MKDTAKTDSPNFKFIDCTSGVQHLHNLGQQKEIRNQYGLTIPYESDEFKNALRLFKLCYFNGCIKSRCTRSIISTELFFKNVAATIDECSDFLIYPYLSVIIEAALKGVWDNCSLGQADYYLPEEPTEEKILTEATP